MCVCVCVSVCVHVYICSFCCRRVNLRSIDSSVRSCFQARMDVLKVLISVYIHICMYLFSFLFLCVCVLPTLPFYEYAWLCVRFQARMDVLKVLISGPADALDGLTRYICIYIYIYVFIYIYIYIYMCVCVRVCARARLYIDICLCIYIDIYMYIHTYICVCVHIYIYRCSYIHICMCVYDPRMLFFAGSHGRSEGAHLGTGRCARPFAGEREREREREKETRTHTHTHTHIYIYREREGGGEINRTFSLLQARMDVLKVLISGPADALDPSQETPYALGLFEFHLFIPSDYPSAPPLVNLQVIDY